jgi:tetratricopeptide (TPR) repeat protein
VNEADDKRFAELGHRGDFRCVCGSTKPAAVAFGAVCKYKGLTAQEVDRQQQDERRQRAGQELKIMDGEELTAALVRITADLAEQARQCPTQERYVSVMRLQMRAAWLLIALGRYDQAIASAAEANRARTGARKFTPDETRRYEGAVLWQACEARAVAHLARGQWSEAEEAACEALQDFPEQDENHRLYELALQAQGRLEPNRVYKVSKDPVRELAEFDAKRYAVDKINKDRRL